MKKNWFFVLCLICLSATFAQSLDLSGFSEVSSITLEDGRRILTDKNGLTLYTFDDDQASGESTCFGRCLRVWPALETMADVVPAPFSLTTRPDGVQQLVLENEPLYFFFQDKLPGDILGDGLGGVWHIIEL
ncbi:MAG: hypothetical protein K9K67_15875 [Bacteriovoracaceae bacterium]|nr:hypothetical protein [Bacteriovoracaceae bacterium]